LYVLAREWIAAGVQQRQYILLHGEDCMVESLCENMTRTREGGREDEGGRIRWMGTGVKWGLREIASKASKHGQAGKQAGKQVLVLAWVWAWA
jgi:hypothetical protein